MSEWPGVRPHGSAGAAVVDDMLFRFLVGLEVQKARRLRYCVSLVCLAAEVDASETAEPPGPSLAPLITGHLRGTDVVAPWDPTALVLLLVDAEKAELPAILRRLTSRLAARGWSAGGSCYPQNATHPDVMLSEAVAMMHRAKNEGGNRLCVAA